MEADNQESELVPVGRIVGFHGLKGFVKVELLTDFPEKLDVGAKLKLGKKWVEVVESAVHKNTLQLKFAGYSDLTSVEPLRGLVLKGPNTHPELEEDEYMLDDLIGLKVFDQNRKDLGKVSDVLALPAQDVLLVGELMIPMVKQFVTNIDLEAGRIDVELIPGMLVEEEGI